MINIRLSTFISIIVASTLLISLSLSEAQIPGNDEMFGWIKEVYTFGSRRPGTEGDYKVAHYIMTKFREFGLKDVRKESIPITVWTPDKWDITVSRNDQILSVPSFPMPYSGFTDATGVSGEMVYVGQTVPLQDIGEFNVKGKVVVVELVFNRQDYGRLIKSAFSIYDPDNTINPGDSRAQPYFVPNLKESYQRVHKAGALGIVYILRDMPLNWRNFYEGYDGIIKPMPALFIGAKDGEILRKFLREGKTFGKLVVTGTTKPGQTWNVMGFLPGKSDEIIAIASEHDSPFQGAVQENGWSVVLALAKYFSKHSVESHEKTLMFISCAGHFYGSIGKKDFLVRHADDIAKQLMVWIHIEHIAKEFIERDGKLIYTGQPEVHLASVMGNRTLLTLTADSIKKGNVIRTIIAPGKQMRPFSSGSIPYVQFISGPMYLLVDEDTLDKVDIDRLQPVATAFVDLVEKLDKKTFYSIR